MAFDAKSVSECYDNLYYDDPARIVLIRRVDSYQGAESSCRTNYQLPCRYGNGLWTRSVRR